MKILERPGAGLFAGALSIMLGMPVAQAATCMDELDRFERRLNNSNLAVTDPDTFQALARQAEEAAELRDEEQCLQSVAELNSELPEQAEPVSRSPAPKETRDRPRPAAPVLLVAGGTGGDSTRETPDENDADGAEEDSEATNDPANE